MRWITEPSARSTHWRAATLPLLFGLCWAAPAAAQNLRADVNVHGSPDEVLQLEATLRSLFPPEAELHVAPVDTVDAAQLLREPSTPSTDDVVARAWIELHDGAKVTIYVIDRSGERILVRHLPRGDENAELANEATARVVATALEALLSGAQIGVERAKVAAELAPPPPPPPTPPPVQPPRPAPPAPAALAFRLGAHYGAQLFSSQLPVVHGPGLVFGASDNLHLTRPGAELVAQAWLPNRREDDIARVRVYSGALRLLATVERRVGNVTTLGAGLGAGIDLTRVEPAENTTSVQVRVAAPRTLLTPALRAALGARFRPSTALSVYTTLSLDADPSGTRYVSRNDGVTTNLLEPRALRPSLALGVATP
jgi:hypothetical protein